MVSPLDDSGIKRGDLSGVIPPTPGPKNGRGSPEKDGGRLDDALDR